MTRRKTQVGMHTIERTERGWGGHFICSHYCLFRRNTLLQRGEVRIVVSTVGAMRDHSSNDDIAEIGLNRYYETMAFHAQNSDDSRYWDADVSKQIYFTADWCIDHLDADDEANDMHEKVVTELTARLVSGEVFDV